MSIPALIGEGHSPSKFGPGFGKKAGQLRFFAGHTDRRYPIPGELGSNEHLKGRFGAELSTMLPSSFGVESSPLTASQRNRAGVSAWLQPPHRSAHPGFSFAAADYATPERLSLTHLPNVEPRWASRMMKSSSERGLTRLMDERLQEDYGTGALRGNYEVQVEALQNKPRSQKVGTHFGPGFGSSSPERFPPIRDATFGRVRRPVRRLKASESAPSLGVSPGDSEE